MFTVVVTEKGGNQRRIGFDEESVSIGRVQGNEVILPKGNVSKRHAKVELKNGQFTVSDVESTNGTFVNGRRIQGPTPIFQGDKIYIGDFIVSLEGNEALLREDAPAAASKPISPVKPSARPPVPAPARHNAPVQKAELEEDKEQVQAEPQPEPDARKREKDEDVWDKGATLSSVVQTTIPSPPPSYETMESRSENKPESGKVDEESAVEGSPEADETEQLVFKLLDKVARQVKRIDRGSAPSKVDSGTAGTVRIAINESVEELIVQGKLPQQIDPYKLRGKVFRAAVDLGDLGLLLDDQAVEMIRVTGPNTATALKKGEWISVPCRYSDDASLIEALRCLGSGLEMRDDDVQGLSRYRLEEGYVVFATLPPAAVSGAAVVIDKTSGGHFGRAILGRQSLEPDAQELIENAIGYMARIGVAGGPSSARLNVIDEIVGMLPAGDFLVSVEDLPLLNTRRQGCVSLCTRPFGSNERGEQRLRTVLSSALHQEPSWISISGILADEAPFVLNSVAGRSGVVVEIPLYAVEPLHRELAATMAVSGSDISLSGASLLLNGAVDTILIAGRSPSGRAEVRRIISASLSAKGQWSPQTVYKKETKS